MIRKISSAIFLLTILLSSGQVIAQKGNLFIFGSINDYQTFEKIEGAIITAISEGVEIKSSASDAEGNFELYLPLQKAYRIQFAMENYTSKFVDVDSRDIPEQKIAGGFSMQLDMNLFTQQPGLDFSIFNEPIAKSKYSNETGSIDWDQDYSTAYSKKVDAVFSGLINKYTEETKIRKLLNDWHAAAATSDHEIYFESLTDDALYLGTDKTERWTKRDFEVWAEPHFKKAEAWVFKSYDRFIYFSDDYQTAWFDELLDTWMGTCRGTGVVVRTDAGWRIKQYSLTLTIDNADIKNVIEACEKE